MDNRSIPIDNFRRNEKCFVQSPCDKEDNWTEEQQLVFIDGVLRGTDFPTIILRELPNTKPQEYEVIEGFRCIETLQKLLSSKLPIPSSLKDLPIFANHTSLSVFKGKKVLGQYSLLPDELRQQIWEIPYPVKIIR